MKIAVTGHRPDKIGGYSPNPLTTAIARRMDKIVDDLKAAHSDEVMIRISGMALGADTLWAHLAQSSGDPLIAAIPFQEQDLRWPPESRRIWNQLLNYARSTTDRGGGVHLCCTGGYSPLSMQKRNEWMVDNCNLLIAVWNGSAGGTANCVKYARTKLKEEQIIYIDPSKIMV